MPRHTLFLFLLLLTASAAWAKDPQHETKIHPPPWAMGTWQNLAENNTRYIVTLQVSNDAICISRGLQAPAVDLLSQYRGWTIMENTSGDLYRITFGKQGQSELFEVKFLRPDPVSGNPRALTLYTGRAPAPTTAHTDSINLLLMNLADLPPRFGAGRLCHEKQSTRE